MDAMIREVHTNTCNTMGRSPLVLLVCPVHIRDDMKEWSPLFGGGTKKSGALAQAYRAVAHQHGCHLFNATAVVQTALEDGIRLDAPAHRMLGQVLTEPLRLAATDGQT